MVKLLNDIKISSATNAGLYFTVLIASMLFKSY